PSRVSDELPAAVDLLVLVVVRKLALGVERRPPRAFSLLHDDIDGGDGARLVLDGQVSQRLEAGGHLLLRVAGEDVPLLRELADPALDLLVELTDGEVAIVLRRRGDGRLRLLDDHEDVVNELLRERGKRDDEAALHGAGKRAGIAGDERGIID